MQEKESLLANLRLTTSQATSNQTAAVYTSPVPTEGGVNLEGQLTIEGILKSKKVNALFAAKILDPPSGPLYPPGW